MLLSVCHELCLQRLSALFCRRNAFSRLHKQLHLLHLIAVRHSDAAAHLHLVVRVEDVLDLCRIDVVSGGDYHPLRSSAEVYESLAVHAAEVSGVYPCEPVLVPAQSIGCLIRHVHVALHHRWACKEYLTFFAVRNFLVCARLYDLVVSIRERYSYAAFLVHLRRRKARCGNALCCAVALAHLHLGIVVEEELVQLLLELYGE